MEDYRNKTKKVQIGNVCIGGGERIAIQSMTNTKTEDVEACVAQILKLEKAGCDIIRVAAVLKQALGVAVRVKLVEPKTIERSEGKAKRVIDNRSL